MTDQQLVESLRAGAKDRRRALEYIYHNNFVAIRSYVLANNGTKEDSRDIFQDGVMILVENIGNGKFSGGSSIRTYLYSICRNLWLHRLRSSRRGQIVELSEASMVTNEPPLAPVDLEKLKSLMNELKEDCRKLLVAFYYDGKSMAEVAGIFNLGSDQAARNKKMRCMENLVSIVKSKSADFDEFLL